jgi:pimeloyl-ACP methyl ester carboxylesterase
LATPNCTSSIAAADGRCLLCGEHDAISTPQEMGGIAAAIAGAEFVVVEDAGHMSPLEAPQPVNDAIRRLSRAT